jgi:hypothetical protein
MWWFMLAILTVGEIEIGSILVQGQSGQKVNEMPSQQTSWIYIVHIYNPSFTGNTGGLNQRQEMCSNLSKK